MNDKLIRNIHKDDMKWLEENNLKVFLKISSSKA